MKSILEESFPQKTRLKIRKSRLIEVKPGTYMMLSTNKMKRIARNTQGLELGQRVKGDNHKAVLIEDDVILVPFDDK
jgi:hypothetical protein